MSWHFARAHEWLTAAANGSLLSTGDPFELPVFPTLSESQVSIATFEDDSTFPSWTKVSDQFGTVEIVEVNSNNKLTYVATRFEGSNGEIVSYPVGKYLPSGEPAKQIGIWIRCDAIPVLEPYQAPRTWEELRIACDAVWKLLPQACWRIRDGLPHFLLVGFPIPRIVGQPASQMHWQPIQLPVLSFGTQHAPGFRAKTSQGYWQRDKHTHFRSADVVDWQEAENWSKEMANARGRFGDALLSQSVAVIGIGAVGSYLSELLVRGGVDKAVTIDGESFSYGNLCRHTLGLGSIDRPKSRMVAARLNTARATSNIDFINAKFPKLDDAEHARLQECTLIVDCTGSDETLHDLENYPWSSEKYFCSVSVGYQANRTYVYLARGTKMPFQQFREQIAPWLERDVKEFGTSAPRRESVGCWHISYPGRVDQIVMAAAVAARCLDEWAVGGFGGCGLHVYEQSATGITEVAFTPDK